MKVLVAGWFSFELMGATAGDLQVKDVVCHWLEEAGRDYDVATAPPFTGGIDWATVDPSAYTDLVFVCGPCGNGEPLTGLLERFAHCRLAGVSLSMLQPLDEWNPFDLLLERESSAATRADVAFLADGPRVPVVGVVLVHHQQEYARGMHDSANAAIERLVRSRPAVALPIDTRLDENGTGLRSPAEVEALIARMDVVVTTRLHGMVLALKNGVPAVVIDPVGGGAKVFRQAAAVEWPAAFTADALEDERLEEALAWCLTEDARRTAAACAARARFDLGPLHIRFVEFFTDGTTR